MREDLQWRAPEEIHRLLRLLYRYKRWLLQAATNSPMICERFLRVLHMRKPSSHLLSPRLISRFLFECASRALLSGAAANTVRERL